jgi:hypothetical protein
MNPAASGHNGRGIIAVSACMDAREASHRFLRIVQKHREEVRRWGLNTCASAQEVLRQVIKARVALVGVIRSIGTHATYEAHVGNRRLFGKKQAMCSWPQLAAAG